MFEKLAGNVLSKVLSNYFTEESLAKNNVYKKTQLGVWSGYVTLNDLEVKVDVINKKLRQKGQPFELVHCSLRQVEITIPWAKLSNPISSRFRSFSGGGSNSYGSGNGSSSSNGAQDAVVVLVMDGVHALFRTTFEFHDDDLREEDIKQRRKALSMSEDYAKSTSSNVEEYCNKLEEAVGNEKSYTDLLKQRISSGLLQEVARQVHVHIRDMHIRIEDTMSDPENPFAFGVTMESMHLQHDDEDDKEQGTSKPGGVVSKVAQMNHFAAYWNALEYGRGLLAENSILHEVYWDDKIKLSRALDQCIARRASAVPSPSKKTYIPKNTYVLLPVDGYLHALLSATPKDLSIRPAVDIAIQLDRVSTNLRDFQCVQMLKIYGERENFNFVKKFRKYRPKVPVEENARIWWKYAAQVIRHELRGSMLRWSWVRFQKRYALRARYMELYERRIRYGSGALPTETNDDAARIAGEDYTRPLTDAEKREIQDLEDGIVGGLSTADIILYRALTSVRLGGIVLKRIDTGDPSDMSRTSSWWKETVVEAAIDDVEAKNELGRLLQYLDEIPSDKLVPESKNDSLSAVTVVIQLEEVNFAMFSPLHFTSEETQLKRLHEKFLELNTKVTRIGGSLKGDYKRFDFEFSVMDFNASEIRLDKSNHVIAGQLRKELSLPPSTEENQDDSDEKPPLFLFSYSKRPLHNPKVDKQAKMFFNAVEIMLFPECQWLAHMMQFMKEITTVSKVKKFWRELSLARLNSLALGRLGLIAKAESVVSYHETMDVDFNLHCPVIRVGIGDDGDVIFDTGCLSVKTQKLAGLSHNMFEKLPLPQETRKSASQMNDAERWQDGIDDGSLAGMVSVRTRSTRRRPIRRFFLSSTMSVDSATFADHGNRSHSESFNLDGAIPIDHGKGGQDNPDIQDLFYDKYQLNWRFGRITFSGESELFDIVAGFDIQTILQKSVIPSDHTLSKLKVHTTLGRLKILLNENIVSRLGSGVSLWKSLLVTDVTSGNFQAKRHDVPFTRLHQHGTLFDFVSSPKGAEGDNEEGSANALDENEFFDANERADSVGGDNSGVWFEDNWIADAESVIDGGSRSSLSGRRGRRRQPSLSDMSSVSDHSAGRIRKGHIDNGYLSAENLARLEEAAGDEEDTVDSKVEKEDDSFHSTMSAEGQEKLIRELEDDIEQTEGKISGLSKTLKEISASEVNNRINEDRKMRKEIKLKLQRSKTELKALQVLLSDLKSMRSEGPTDSSVVDASNTAQSRRQQTRSVRTLLRARKRRDTNGTETGHSLVNSLNRALFKGSILVNKVEVGFRFREGRLGDIDERDEETPSNNVNLDLVVNQVGLALFHHVNETKLYFSLDQVALKAENHEINAILPSNIVFSGGTTDTMLPSQLPHLVAHSMEDRLIRGAINFGKHRISEAGDQLAKTIKLRLVLGDIELSPFEICVRPITECMGRLKAKFSSPDSTAPNTSKDLLSKDDGPGAPCVSDLAFRFASFRVAICHRNTVVGALALSETSLRFVRMSSYSKDRAQIDIRCTNAQLLHVLNLEAGRGLELFGRRDPYNSLLQARGRFQVIPAEERGGWVISETSTLRSNAQNGGSGSLVRNVHIGARVNPLSVVISPDALYKLLEGVHEIRETMLHLRNHRETHKNQNEQERIQITRIPLRWRVDVTLRRVTIKLSKESKDEWDTTDDLGAKMLVALTIVASIQEAPTERNAFSVRIGITDTSLIRSSDDWPILEPFAVVFELVMVHHLLQRFNCSSSIAPLQMKSDSAMDEIHIVMARHGWDSIPTRKAGDVSTKLVLKLTPLKVNISAPIILLFAEVAESMKRRKSPNENLEEKDDGGLFLPTSKDRAGTKRFGVLLSIDDIEIQLLQETEGKAMALAHPLISFTLTDAAIDYSQGDQVTASILIRDSALFDLSCGRGIRVVGEDPEARLEFPYFVRVKLYMHDGPQTVRLHINWGRIQCLLIPSFVRALLDLKTGLKHLKGKSSNPAIPSPVTKQSIVSKFLHHPNDVNLILSADAETFECILASKDVIEYVKTGAKDPLGVVTFRWKASLSVAVALDSLRESSMPWLTLNLDGVFTDDEDASLFKDFSNRYLFRGPGTLDSGQEGSFHNLANAFTLRLSHRLSGFQALRTNIAKLDLTTSSRGFVAIPRVCFKISQPSAGEQRITNPIDFTLLYRAVGASVIRPSDSWIETLDVELAQLLQLKSNFVDVLLYIQSKIAGGFTDSYQATIKPILEMFSRKEGRRHAEANVITESAMTRLHQPQVPKLLDLLKRAPTVCSLHIEGFQVTCVPGGASRLNESPIIKFELSNVFSGVAAAPVPQDLTLISSTGGQKVVRSPSKSYISGSELRNTTIVGWMGCQLTSHYHNRRLVAWEPVIEPWTANIRFGVDLVEVLQWLPIVKFETTVSSSPSKHAVHELDARETSFSAAGKERLRDFGRLFRSPFQQSMQSSDSPRKRVSELSHSDFCFLMLSSSTRKTIAAALYPTGERIAGTESTIFSTLPSSAPLDWLHNFGRPDPNGNSREIEEPFSISVVLCDNKPLNINVTGALIENVMGYIDHAKKVGSKTVVPHLIRNDTGMTVRFREVLDVDRSKRGESAAKIILGNGFEAPLTLKRSLSQTCDPHRAFINLEIGNFEDTVGRVNHDDFDISKGKRSSTFFFKAAAKIPVDAVGVHRYPLDRNVDLRSEKQSAGPGSRALGWIIVRVALRGSVKVVSVESPFVIKSAADADLLCEIRDHSGFSLLWRCLVPKDDGGTNEKGLVSVPADIVPFIHDRSYRFSVVALPRDSSYNHEAEISSIEDSMTEISIPPPFSSDSFGKGLIGEEEVSLPMIPMVDPGTDFKDSSPSQIHLTACAVRIGSVNLSPVDEVIEVPEQRMVFFRAPLLLRNFLALPIAVQIRVKSYASVSGPSANLREPALLRRNIVLSEWEDLGVLDCGESVNWTGAQSSDLVQVRARFVGVDGDNSRRFPGWSSAVEIPAREHGSRALKGEGNTVFAKMKVQDAENASLSLSVAVEHGSTSGIGKHAEEESIRRFCRNFSSATRVVSIFVPFWIIDGTHQDLEFYAGTAVAGQLEGSQSAIGATATNQFFGSTLGLAELMDNTHFLDTSSKTEFDVLMVGDGASNKLTVRKRPARKGRTAVTSSFSPWSDPIPLLSGQKSRHDLTVLTPKEHGVDSVPINDDANNFDRLLLRSRIVNATEKFGGHLGTKLVHIVNRYSVSNETGRDIEIDSNGGYLNQNVVSATSRPEAFHFDDSRPVRFRFKEYGWSWSGYFNVRSSRREVTLRIRHRMKGQSIIVTIELRATKQSATSLLVFRQSNYPPFRLENHTMHLLRFGQSLSVLGQEESECDSMLLQYQSADFAWDEPELRRRILIVKSSGSTGFVEDTALGRFSLDKIAPGTAIKLENDIFTAEIVADGPTRVLRVSDASMPRVPSFRQDEFDYFKHAPKITRTLTISLVAKMSHGIGISVVDFSPKELLYIRLEDIYVEKKIDTKKDNVSCSIGCLKLNNQLWVTPYPILLRMGRQYDPKLGNARRRNRRHDALSVSWKSSLNTHGGYGNVTLLDSFEVSSEPVFVNVDGELAGALYRMARHVAEIRSHGKESVSSHSRDEVLKSLLTIRSGGEAAEESVDSLRTGRVTNGDIGVDSAATATAASAAKLRSNPEYQSSFNTVRLGHYHGRMSARKRKRQLVSKVQHKFYIERLRISTTRADLSWSGPLPGLVSSLLLKALTFERLPVRLRPYSSSHAYGNFEDHMQLLKLHYLSVWRIADLLVGLSSNPTFLFRAVIYTLRESCAAFIDACAFTVRESSIKLNRAVSRDTEFQPIYDDDLTLEDANKSHEVLRKVCTPLVTGTVLVLNSFSTALSWFSSLLKYGNQSGSTQRTRGLVRSRNPRLFAHVDGKDLLVEYVEGENAGKALLSRVRMGLHLGEGYFFHAEGARQRRSQSKFRTDLDPSPYILMITSERVLLLSGRLDHGFCSVAWESFFLNIVHVTVVPADELSTFTYDEIVVWHLCDPEFSEGNQIQVDGGSANVFATNIVSGIDVLRCQSIFVPRLVGKQVLQKMHSVDNRLGH